MEGDKDKDWDHDTRRERRRSPSRSPGRAARFKSYTSRSQNRKRFHSRERRGIQDAHQRSSILVASKKLADVSETFADVKLGIAGCNKIENSSYMDGGRNRKEEKIPGDKDYIHGNYLTGLEELLSMSKEAVAGHEQDIDLSKKSFEMTEEFIKLESKIIDNSKKDEQRLRSRVGDVFYDSIFRVELSRREQVLSAVKNELILDEQYLDMRKENVENLKKVKEMLTKHLYDKKKRFLKFRGGCVSTS